MKFIKYLIALCALFVVAINVYAQNIIQTPVRVDDFKNTLFSGKGVILCNIPISQSDNLQLSWQEKETSFTNRGIRSFIGYNDDKIVATISFSNKSFLGTLFTDTGEKTITEQNDYITLIDENQSSVCNVNNDDYNEFKVTKSLKKAIADTSTPVIKNDDVLRIYRLAVLVDYSVFTEWKFKSNKANVATFLADLESFLNNLYYRDLGIKFELVKADALIIDRPEKEVFHKNPSTNDWYYNSFFTAYGTEQITKLIGDNSYDLGIVMTRSKNGGGLANLYGAYKKQSKGASTTDSASPQIIAHEIGHLFGGRHTFSNSRTFQGSQTEQTELGRGSSVMSYGTPRNFFSLSSIEIIRSHLVGTPYYEDEQRTFVKGHYVPGETNVPLGIELNNKAPKIDKTSIKQKYTLPKQTFFQFNINATDSDQDELTYFAQQRDVEITSGVYPVSKTLFKTYPGSKDNFICFQTEYTSQGQMLFNTIGNCTFWLGVSDSKELTKSQITKYDLAETKVEIVEGKPFKITSAEKKEYQAGEKMMLTWSVDEKIFENTKVRILMSDDFGKTFKYTLVESAENNGSCELTIPPIKTDKEGQHGKGLIKIEVIDHIAYAVTNYNPLGGGFTIKNNGISFYDCPKDNITVYNEVPDIIEPKASTTCHNNDIRMELKETTEKDILIRTWTVTDDCGNTATFNQKIRIKKTVPTVPTNTEFQLSRTSLYPNPVKNHFSLSGFNQIVNVSVFDTFGVLVKVFNEKQREYNIEELNEGNYIVVIRLNDNTEKTFKIMKVNP